MKILFVCPGPPTPIKRRPFNFALHLARRHEVHLRVLARADEIRAYRRWSASRDLLSAACASFEILPVSLPRLLAASAIGYARGDALRIAYTLAHGRHADLLNRQCDALRIEVAHVDRLRLARLGRKLAGPAVVDLPDCMSWATQQWAAVASLPRALFYARESQRLRRFEGGELNEWEHLLVASAEDARRLRECGYRGVASSIPGIIDLQEGDETTERTDAPLLVFHGHLSYPPNVDAAVSFVGGVFGALRKRWRSLRLAIVGVSPAGAVRRLAAIEGVRVVPNVKHIGPWLRAATAVIAPMRIGAGHSQKICEAMLTGRPVICSPTVAARLPLEVRARLLLAEDPEQWVEHLRLLIDDPARARAIGDANQCVARKHYSPEAVLPQLDAAYLRAS